MTTAGKWTKRSTLKSRMSSHIFISAAEIQQQILNRQLEYELLIAVTGVIHQCAADVCIALDTSGIVPSESILH